MTDHDPITGNPPEGGMASTPPAVAATELADAEQALAATLDPPSSWKNLALEALAHVSPADQPDLFTALHQLVAVDARRAVIWVVKPVESDDPDYAGWMYLARNLENGQTLVVSETVKNRVDAIDMARFLAAPGGYRVVDEDGRDL